MSVSVTDKNTVAEIASGIERILAAHPPLEGVRREALASLLKLGLPGNKSEEYKHTPVTRLLEKNFSFTVANAPSTVNDFSGVRIPAAQGYEIFFVNGEYRADLSTLPADSNEVTVLPLTTALVSHEEEVTRYLSRVADYGTDPLAAWNTAAWTEGVYISVGANKQVSKPVYIYHIHDAVAGQVLSAVRALITVGKSSEITVVEKYDTMGPGNGFSSLVSEAVVAENAGLNWYCIQNDEGNRYQFDMKQIQQSSSSRVKTYTFTMNGKLIRNNLNLALDGEGIDSHMYGLYLLGNDTIADNHTVVDHRLPNSFSNELYKGIIDDSARGVFNGKIYVRPHAQKTNAFQANRNILLTDKAVINTKPQLEIWADDVKCSHGCTSGQLDEEAMFYLQTRGISRDSARAMMLYAFAGELLTSISDESLRAYIDGLLAARLHKNF